MGMTLNKKITKRRPKYTGPYRVGDIVRVVSIPGGGEYHITGVVDLHSDYNIITTVGDILKVIQVPITKGHLTLQHVDTKDTVLLPDEHIEIAPKVYQVIYG